MELVEPGFKFGVQEIPGSNPGGPTSLYFFTGMRPLAILAAVAFSIPTATAFQQASVVPYAPNSDGSGPTFSIKNVSHIYPGLYSSIRDVDFGNFRFPVFDGATGVLLRNGHYKHEQPGDYQRIDLESIHYLSARSLPSRAAIVLLSWFAAGGSSSQGGCAMVFTITMNLRLRTVQEINWDTHFNAGGPTNTFDSDTSTLVVRSAHYIPGDSHCCVSAMDVVTFRWDGSRFIERGLRTELSRYGKEQGRILPR